MVGRMLPSRVLLSALLRSGQAQLGVEKFKFLPVGGYRQWGVHLNDHATESYNEWNPDNPSCRPLYESYLRALHAKEWHLVPDLIYNTSACILDSCSDFQQETIQASAVLLGFSPIMLASAGPTPTEVALISLQRPWLALLFSLGTAAVYPTRLLCAYDDTPRAVLGRLTQTDKLLDTWLQLPLESSSAKIRHILVGIIQYSVALAAAFNVLYTSWQLGVASISVLDCPRSFYPLIWALFPLITHALVCGAHHFDSLKRRRRTSTPDDGGGGNDGGSGSIEGRQPGRTAISQRQKQQQQQALGAPPSPAQREETFEPERRQRSPSSLLLHLLPSSSQPKLPAHILEPPSMMVDMLHRLATALTLAQTIYGVVVFSSLLFVAAADAAVILLRFLASVISCRIAIMLDLGGMRVEVPDEDERCEGVRLQSAFKRRTI